MKRAMRRHHRERILRKRIKQYLSAFGGYPPGAKIEEEYLRPAGTMANHSALGCKNPRCYMCHPDKYKFHRTSDRQKDKKLIDEQINEG